jgi:hypothetical protein
MPPKSPASHKKKTKKKSGPNAELIASIVRAILSENGEKGSVAQDYDLRREIHKMQESFNERLSVIENNIATLRSFADDTSRGLAEQHKSFEEKLNTLSGHFRDDIEEERRKRLKLLRTVHKAHSEDVIRLKDALTALKDDADKKSRLFSDDIKFISHDMGRIKENVDEL